MTQWGTSCCIGSLGQTPGTQILLILWLHGMYDQEPTRKSLFMRAAITCGMNHTFFEYALTGYSGGVSRRKKEWRSLRSATHHHMEVIMELSAHMQRSGKADFSGQPCIKTQKISYEGATLVRGMRTSIPEIPCHWQLTFRSSSLMSGELTKWDHYQNLENSSTS
jgi:hypothetical protein